MLKGNRPRRHTIGSAPNTPVSVPNPAPVPALSFINNIPLPPSSPIEVPLSVSGVPLVGCFEKETLVTPRSKNEEKGKENYGCTLDSVTANTILCDEETYHLARSRFFFVQLDPVSHSFLLNAFVIEEKKSRE
jgi:hypothetical protein